MVRGAWSVTKTVKDTIQARRSVLTWWSPKDQQWHYSWRDGRAVDSGRWSDSLDWATRGFNYDLHDLLWRHYAPSSGDVVIDIGAGHGGETFYLAEMVGEPGRVLAVEASPSTFARLEQLCALNNWPQVQPVNEAVSDRNGTIHISSNSEWVADNMFGSGGTEVPCTTVDELCARYAIERVDWLKMNIEGAEREALKGMEGMASRVSNVTISCHDFLGTEWGATLEFVTTWLVDRGFTVIQRADGDFVQQLYVYGWRSVSPGVPGVGKAAQDPVRTPS